MVLLVTSHFAGEVTPRHAVMGFAASIHVDEGNAGFSSWSGQPSVEDSHG